MLRAFIVVGAPGSGKSANAEKLQEAFSCPNLVEEWKVGDQVQANTLHMATVAPEPSTLYQIVDIADALLFLDPGDVKVPAFRELIDYSG